MTPTEPSKPAGIAIAIVFTVASLAMLALARWSSHWWLLPAFLAGLTGVVGLGVELSRPVVPRVVVHPVGSAEAAALLSALDEFDHGPRGPVSPVRPVSDLRPSPKPGRHNDLAAKLRAFPWGDYVVIDTDAPGYDQMVYDLVCHIRGVRPVDEIEGRD